jgi:hypothetical protein
MNGSELGRKFVQPTLSNLVTAFGEKTWRLVNLQVVGGGTYYLAWNQA